VERVHRGIASMYVKISAEGKYVLEWNAGPSQNDVNLFDSASGNPAGGRLVVPAPHAEFVFTQDETKLVSIRARGETGEVRLWDIETGRVRAEAPPFTMKPSDFAYWGKAAASPDSRWLALAVDQRIHFWELATLRPLGPPIPIPGNIWGIKFRPGTEQLAVATEKRGVQLLPVPPAIAAAPERIRLWVEVATGKELDAGGLIVDLDVNTWRERYDRLQKLGGPP
jgi:hypothetical protein